MNSRPKQLEKLRKEHYDKLYKRQPQLLERLIPLFKHSEIIEFNTEPLLNGKIKKDKQLIKDLNKTRNLPKLSNSNKKLISEIRPDILWNLR